MIFELSKRQGYHERNSFGVRRSEVLAKMTIVFIVSAIYTYTAFFKFGFRITIRIRFFVRTQLILSYRFKISLINI